MSMRSTGSRKKMDSSGRQSRNSDGFRGARSAGPTERYSRLSSRMSRMSNVGAARKKEQADSKRIYDEELGLDVTPKDLLQPPDMEDMGGAASGRDSPLSRHSSQSAESRGSMARGVGAAASQNMMTIDDMELSPSGTPEPGEGLAVDSDRDEEDLVEDMLEEMDLDVMVPVVLSETDTMTLIEMRPALVQSEGAEADAVRAQNERYELLLEEKRSSDRFVHAQAQTLDNLLRSQHCQSQRMAFSEAQVQAFSYEIEDEIWAANREDDSSGAEDGPQTLKLVSHRRELQEEDVKAVAGMSGGLKKSDLGASTMGSMMGSMAGLGSMFGSTMSMMGKQPPKKKGSQVTMTYALEPEEPEKGLHTLPGIKDALQLMEAAVSQGLYGEKLLLFRGITRNARRGATESRYGEHGLPRMSTAMTGVSTLTGGQFGGVPESEEGSRSRRQSRGSEASVASLTRTNTEVSEMGGGGRRKHVGMEHLWDFSCSLFEGKNVSSIAWNKARPDLLAVGYGSFDFTYRAGKFTAKPADQEDAAATGFMALWSLKSPEWPLFWIETPCGVTSVDWSGRSPSILAVGLYDGSINIYDVKEREAVPIMRADHDNGQHTDPVWKLKWVDFGDRGESLVSVSTDSQLIRWSTSKGLEKATLMTLKKQVNPFRQQATGKEAEAFISRNASGMSFDFNTRDESIYVVSTEEGTIHKCSTSYSEQYLESYWGHMGPVYKVQYSPFAPGLFVSASADWTVRVWREGKSEPLLTLHSSIDSVGHAINDVAWCPYNATVLATVTQDGAVELWDLEYSVLAPDQKHQPFPGIAMTCVSFCESSAVLACGAASGKVHLLRLSGLSQMAKRSRQHESKQEAKRLEEVLVRNIMKVKARKGQLDGVKTEGGKDGEAKK